MSSGTGCPGFDTVRVNVHANPVVTMSPQEICNGLSATFDAGNTGGIYAWSGIGSGTSQTAQVNSTGSISVTVTDVFGCVGVGTSNLIVNENPVVSVNSLTICEGAGPQILTATSDSTASIFSWTGAGIGNVSTISAITAGMYTVNVVDNNGCLGTGSGSLTINPIPVFDIGTAGPVCYGETATVGVLFDNSHTAIWSTGETTMEILIAASGTYELTIADANGCSSTDDLVFIVNSLPTYQKSNDTTVCFEIIGDMTINVTTDSRNSLLWNDGSNGLDNQVFVEGAHVFNITDVNNCVVSDTIVVNERCESILFIPNAFTPDGDGINDVFFAKGVNIQDYNLYVFDRWGIQLFHSEDMNFGWNGLFKGTLVQSDVYVYKLYYSVEVDHGGRQDQTQVGTVTVVR